MRPPTSVLIDLTPSVAAFRQRHQFFIFWSVVRNSDDWQPLCPTGQTILESFSLRVEKLFLLDELSTVRLTPKNEGCILQ
jgi:hypothetical protein